MMSYIDASNLYGWSIIQGLTYAGNYFVTTSLEGLLATENDIEIVYFAHVDLEYRDTLEKSTRLFSKCPKSKS